MRFLNSPVRYVLATLSSFWRHLFEDLNILCLKANRSRTRNFAIDIFRVQAYRAAFTKNLVLLASDFSRPR